MNGIDPSIIKFVVALAIAAAVIRVLEEVSSGAAWSLTLIVLLLLFIKNPILSGYLNLGSASLAQGIK